MGPSRLASQVPINITNSLSWITFQGHHLRQQETFSSSVKSSPWLHLTPVEPHVPQTPRHSGFKMNHHFILT